MSAGARATAMSSGQGLVLLIALCVDAKRQKAPIEVQPYCAPGIKPPGKNDPATFAAATARLASAPKALPLDTAPIDVAFFDTRPTPDTSSMLRAAALANATSRVRFHALLKYPRPIPGFRVTKLELPPLAQCLYNGMKRLSHGPGPQYLYKPLLHHVMPADVERLILLDTDIVMVRDVRELFAEFGRFGTACLGVGNEQSNLYGHSGQGKNGGVQLLDLKAMRNEPQYDAVLDYIASGRDGRRIGYLGDQTLYSFLAPDFPHLFYRLPCEWNRQISMHFGFSNFTVHHCPHKCGIIHANFQPFKCVAKMLQANPSCSTWTAFQKRLGEPPDPSYPCPKVSGGQKRVFKHAITRFFDSCCVPDAQYASGWPQGAPSATGGADKLRGGLRRQKKLAQMLT